MGPTGLFPWFRGVRARTTYAAGTDLHVGDIRVLLIVASDRQEICIHRFYVSAAGFGDHGLQCRKPLCVPLEREQLSTATIEQIGLRSESRRVMSRRKH